MFKKLKDKIAEEVKQSPLKSVQQFAQAVVSPTSSSVFEPSSSDDKFCIEEGDIEEDGNPLRKEPSGGFTSVTLTGQTSPPARSHGSRGATADTENLFPVFESHITNFHVQSDWESASEVEDRGQLDHISKENLYDAYRKVHGRYNKMKNKYHELVTHYRHLEREKEKAKTVLSETQDKALLRISELREQCVLEQQAKAHLEEALRNELEERDHIISSLKTKVQYLKTASESGSPDNLTVKHPGLEMDNLIDFTENTCVSKVPSPFVASSNLETVEWLDERLLNCKKFLMEEASKVENLQSQLEELKKINVRTNITEEAAFSAAKELFALEKEPPVETNVCQSIISVINEFSKEIKVIQDTTQNLIPRGVVYKSVDQKLIIEETSDKPVERFENKCYSLHNQENRANTERSRHVYGETDVCELHEAELRQLRQHLNELEMQNQRLSDENKISEEMQTDIKSLHETIDLVKTLIKTMIRFHEQDTFDVNELNLKDFNDNELVKDLNSFITKFVSAKSELETFKSVIVNLEKELKTTKNELNFLKLKEESRVDCVENQSNSQDEHLLEINNELKEQLERLQNDNNDRLTQQEALHLELNHTKEMNEQLEVKIEELKELLDASEKRCHKNSEEINDIMLTLDKEKTVLKHNITELNRHLEDSKKEVTALLNSKEMLSNKLVSLQKEYDSILTEKENLQLSIEELEYQSKQSERYNLTIQALLKSLSEEMTSLRGDHFKLHPDKASFDENADKLKTVLKDLIVDLKTSQNESATLQRELSLLKQNNNDIFTENKFLQDKNIELENEMKQIKEECSTINRVKEDMDEEWSGLKQKYDSITLEKNNLHEQVNKLVSDLDIRKYDYFIIVEERKKLFVDIENLRKKYDVVNTKKCTLEIELESVKKELELQKTNYDSSIAVNNQLSGEICTLKEAIDQIDKEKQKLNIEIVELKSEKNENNIYLKEKIQLQNNLDCLKTDLELCKQDYDKSTKDLSAEVASSKKEKAELEKEMKTLKILIDDLHKEADTKEVDLVSCKETIEQLTNEITISKAKQDSLIKDKEDLLRKLKNLEEEVQNCRLELTSCVEIRDSLSDKVFSLTQKDEAKSKEIDILKRKFDELMQECNLNKISHETSLKESNKLSDDLVVIKKELEDTVFVLNSTKEQLGSQEEACTKLNNQLHELKESFNSKCNDVKEQEQNNIQLKNDVVILTKQLNQIKASLETITNERDYLVSNVVDSLTTLRDIRQAQLKLFSFVRQFKEELTSEFNNINIKISKDLLSQVKVAVKSNEDYDKQIGLEYKTKKDIDSYNSKIKTLQDHTQSDAAIVNCNLPFQEHSNTQQQDHVSYSEVPIDKESDLQMKLSQLQIDITTYKGRCSDLEVSLSHAVSVMKSIHSFLKARFDNSMLKEQGLIFERKGEKITETGEREFVVDQQQISAIESFINEYQGIYFENDHSVNAPYVTVGHKMNSSSFFDVSISENGPVKSHMDLGSDCIIAESKDFNQHAAKEGVEDIQKEVFQKTKSSKCRGQMDSSSLEIQQLKKEVKLKEDLIKKLQCLVEEYEEERSASTKNQVKSKENTDDPVILTNVEHKNTIMNTIMHDEQYIRLEQENKILLEKLETMKHTYEENVNQLTAAFENKLGEIEEIEKLNEVDKSGKEKKFILNEMKEQIENLQHELDRRGDAFEKLYEDHQQLIKLRENEVQQLRSNYQKEMREQDKKWRSCLDRKLAEEELRHKEEVDTLTCEWAAHRKELETASQLAMSVVGSGSSSSDMLRHQVQALTLQLSQLQSERYECQERCKSPVPSRTIQDCTEMEYLRNILYDYMMGKEPVILAKVLCALMKFTENQTNNIVTKEEQRLTLFGQLGL